MVSYDIDGAGRRVGRHKTGGSWRRYLLGEGNRVVAEYNEAGTIVSRFVYATRSHVPDFMIQGSNVYRFITDQLGSVRLVVNVNASTASASVVQRIDYDAWGNVTNTPTSFDQPFGFAGGLWDRDTGLVHFGAREYDPVTGRWLQKDPIRFRGGDTNLYAYVGGDPVNRIDPSGKLAWLLGYYYAIGTIGAEAWGNDPFSHPHANHGWGPFMPFPGSWAPDWHRDRNSRQACPPVVSGCRDNSSYTLDVMGGAHDHSTYRGNAPSTRGFQCSYTEGGKLSTDPVLQGSYDYFPPHESMLGHAFVDVLPAFVFGTSPR